MSEACSLPDDMDEMAALQRSFIYYATELEIISSSTKLSQILQVFNEWFGASPRICVHLWIKIRSQGPLPRGCTPKYLLWGLMFLRVYLPEKVMKKMVKADVKTCRKWIWYMVEAVANTAEEVIVWNERFSVATPWKSKVTVDGTDFRVRQPTHDKRRWFSYKFRTAGLRYEVAVCIATGHIVWINGPYVCSTHDFAIYKKKLKWRLNWGERVEADAGYIGDPSASIPKDFQSEEHRLAKNRARSRHESINALLKDFACLGSKFRHDPIKHADAFWAVAVITQLSLKFNEKTTWNPRYTGEVSPDVIG